METTLTEYDLYIYRAVLGLAAEEDWPPSQRSFSGLHTAILHGTIGTALYEQLHAITAYVTARMGVQAVGPEGRARSDPLRKQCVSELLTVLMPGAAQPHLALPMPLTSRLVRCACIVSSIGEYAANGLRVPRYVVAACVGRAFSHAATARLAVLQTARIENLGGDHGGRSFPLLLGVEWASQTRMVLMRMDVHGYAWVPVAQLMGFPAGMEVLRLYASFCLPEFGLPPVACDRNILPAEFIVRHGDQHWGRLGSALATVTPSTSATPASLAPTLGRLRMYLRRWRRGLYGGAPPHGVVHRRTMRLAPHSPPGWASQT